MKSIFGLSEKKRKGKNFAIYQIQDCQALYTLIYPFDKMSLLKPVFTIGSYTAISRVLGFLRDMYIATILGAGALMDTFLVSFKLPNFFRNTFAEGAFNASFVPLFTGINTEQGIDKAKDFAERVLAFMLMILIIFTVIMEIIMPWSMIVLAPGFSGDNKQFDMAVLLTRITFPYLVFISMVSLFGAILNSIGRFAAFAASPIYLNLTLIFSLWALSKITETPAHALALGVTLSGIIQLVIIIRAARKEGIVLKLRKPKLDNEVKLLLRRMVPGMLGTGVMQINLWVDMMIGTLIPSAISYIYYADRINQLPLAMIGIAVGTAVLPLLSRYVKENNIKELHYTQSRALEIAAFFTLPASVALFVIPYPIITVLFEHGAFSGKDALATSYALSAFALGLPAFVLVKLYVPTFFAMGDTKTPVKVAVICLAVNVLLNLTFINLLPALGLMPHIGLALATSCASWLNFTLLMITLKKRKMVSLDKGARLRLIRIAASAIIMGILALVGWGYKPVLGDASFMARLFALLALLASMSGAYFLMIFVTRAISFNDIKAYLRRG